MDDALYFTEQHLVTNGASESAPLHLRVGQQATWVDTGDALVRLAWSDDADGECERCQDQIEDAKREDEAGALSGRHVARRLLRAGRYE